jgi:SecD/SecF fusion protein
MSIYVVTPPKEKIRLGLDLSGGTSFTVAIDEAKLRNNIKAGETEVSEAEVQNQVNRILKDADARAIEVMRNRIDMLGVNEPVIQGAKNHRIIIQLPGISPEQRDAAEKSIQSAAFLEFKLVHKQNDQLVDKLIASGRVPEGYVMSEDGHSFKRGSNYNELVRDPEYAHRLSLFEVPDPRYAFMLERTQDASGAVSYRPVFVLRKAEMTGEALSSASVDIDSMTGGVHVSLVFNAKGAAEFARLTKAYAPRGSRNKDSEVGRQLAIILDDTLYSAPVLKCEIPNGRAVIEGNFSWSEAAVLRNILNAGSLPAPMKILEKRSIESTLGADAIRSGLHAGVIGTLLVALFMAGYYFYCGLVADIALMFNVILLPVALIFTSGFLSIFVSDAGLAKKTLDLPVLTMPGIAGFVLSLGMAVDANVLIFERMREEFERGQSVGEAIKTGYHRAFSAILDSHVTALLTGVILFILGTGPIRGYAVTLSAGVLLSLFTALVVSHLIFNLTLKKERVEPLRMLKFLKHANFDFMRWGNKAAITFFVVTILMLALFLVRAFTNPVNVMSVDFTGGASMTYSYAKKADIGAVRKVVKEVVGDSSLQYESSPDGTGNMLLVKTGTIKVGDINTSKAIENALAKELPDCKFKLAGEENVGSEVGADLKHAAVWSIFATLIGILIYVGIRFEFGFALGGVIALAHDAFFTLGLYSLLGHQVSLTVVAALLTIVGYSISDTIVVFDRIREDIHNKDMKMDFKALCNHAMNRTLSRTILTSTTVVIAALSLYVFGGGAINDFALTMLIGLIVGTFSSICIATPIMVAWYHGRRPAFATQNKK